MGPRGSPEWVRFGELPDECPIQIAMRPEAVPIDIAWESCGEGCQRWAGTRGLRWIEGADAGRAWVVALETRPRLVATIALLNIAESRFEVAFREDNTVGGGGPYCSLDVATNAGDVAVVASFSEYDDRGERLLRFWTRFYRSTLAELPSASLLLQRDEYVGSVQTLRVGPTRIAIEANGTSAHAIDDDGTFTIANRNLYPSGVAHLELVGEDLLWLDWDSRSLARSTKARPGDDQIFHSVDGGDVRSFSADGATLAWMHAFDQDPVTLRYARIELWTAQYDGERLVEPRRVNDIYRHNSGMLGDGLYVLEDRETEGAPRALAFHRVADGARAVFSFGTSAPLGDPLYVSGTDVLINIPTAPIRIDPRTLTFE